MSGLPPQLWKPPGKLLADSATLIPRGAPLNWARFLATPGNRSGVSWRSSQVMDEAIKSVTLVTFCFFFSWLIHRWYMADIWIYKSCSHQTHQTWRYHSSMMMGWCLTWLRAPTTWQPPWQISLLTHPTVEWFQPTILVCLVVYTGDYLGGPFLHWSLWLNQWQMCIYIYI